MEIVVGLGICYLGICIDQGCDKIVKAIKELKEMS